MPMGSRPMPNWEPTQGRQDQTGAGDVVGIRQADQQRDGRHQRTDASHELAQNEGGEHGHDIKGALSAIEPFDQMCDMDQNVGLHQASAAHHHKDHDDNGIAGELAECGSSIQNSGKPEEPKGQHHNDAWFDLSPDHEYDHEQECAKYHGNLWGHDSLSFICLIPFRESLNTGISARLPF